MTSAVLSHRGIQKPPAVDTLHRRRFVVDWIWRGARRAGLTKADPCRDLDLPARTTGDRAPLTDQQVAALDVAASTWQSTRKRAVYAAAASGVPSESILDLQLEQIEPPRQRITLDDRILSVAPLHAGFLAEHLATRIQPLPGMHDRRALYGGAAPRDSRQAQVGTILAELGQRAGVDRVTASRLNAWAARRAFDTAGERIEAAARVLGVRSLDLAADRIGWDWR